MIIDYTVLDAGIVRTIEAVEGKGHVKYIRYLLTKRFPPTSIRKELARLALSAPDKDTLTTYFVHILWPVIKGYGLESVYSEYLDRLTKTEFEKDVSPTLKFDIGMASPEMRISFCLFVTELEIEDMWSAEVVRYYGGIENLPQDTNGKRIITTTKLRSVEAVLTCPRKHVIDQLLLEKVSPARISKHLQDRYQIKIDDAALYAYSKHFFNFERRGIEEIIDNLIAEQNSLKSDLDILDSNADYTPGDLATIAKQYTDKIHFLEECIRGLNAQYSDVTYRQGLAEKASMEDMVKDIVQRSYERYVRLDRFTDRDVVKPLADVSKILFTGIDKARAIEADKERAARAAIDKDKSASEVILQLYQESYQRYQEKIATESPEALLAHKEDEDLSLPAEILGIDD